MSYSKNFVGSAIAALTTLAFSSTAFAAPVIVGNGQTVTISTSRIIDGVSSISTLGELNVEGSVATHNGSLDNEGDLNIRYNATFDNSGTVDNSGTIKNDNEFNNLLGGTLNNSGIFTNNTFFDNHGAVTNTGAVENIHILDMKAGSSFDNTGGKLNNNKRIDVRADFAATGVLNLNSGSSLTVYNGATFSNANGRTQANYGDLAVFSGTFDNSGTFLHNNGRLIIFGNGTADNSGTIDNRDRFENLGTTNNSGTIINRDRFENLGTVINSGTFDNTGTFNTRDFLNNGAGSSFDNTGTFNNTGTINNSDFFTIRAGSSFHNTFGTLNNNGEINLHADLAATGVLNLNSGGTLNVLDGATFSNTNGHVQENSGAVNIASGGTVSNSSIWINKNAATINNSGAIDNRAIFNNEGTIHNNGNVDNTGTIINSGRIDMFGSLSNRGISTNEGVLVLHTGSSVDNTGGTIDNDGVIRINTGSSVDNAGGTLNNNAGGAIQLLSDMAATGSLNLKSGSTLTVQNGATFSNTNGHVQENSGTLNIVGGSMIDNSNSSIWINKNAGTVNNFGTIDNSAAFINQGSIDNSGTIDNTGTFDNNGTLKNSGSVNLLAGSRMRGNGSFTQSAGSLTVNGDLTQGSVAINGGTLGGSGTIASTVTVNGGAVGPGNSPGLLQVFGDVAFMTGSTLAVELGGLVFGTGYDRLDVTDDSATSAIEGTASVAAGTLFDIDFFGAFTAGLGDAFDVLVADDIDSAMLSAMLFDFTGAALGSDLGWDFNIVDFGGGREALRLSVVSTLVTEPPTEVPAPGIILIFGLGLAGIGYARRRRAA